MFKNFRWPLTGFFLKDLFTVIASFWISKVFITSLFYKFGDSPDTIYIFSTIGSWLGMFLGSGIGEFFTLYAAKIVGSFELIASVFLLTSSIRLLLSHFTSYCGKERYFLGFALGGLLATKLMAGAIFFHLFSPLGIEVLHNGKSDGGSLFYAAVSIFILGIFLIITYRKSLVKLGCCK